ncbi:glycosyltransferase family 9 protein [Flammeovirga agarivorans]|uniref:Glycosyltransferase family 9 protein n=1 Tax=Flammeovirga agarivorans TaxID=2726742 RepID=A0A7X8SM91_9BACT|nr:glycosyltransferase family 9 protein [Flammeovirga agarivorans]NLR92818.1 glycosyltransferase family 9 protein [Flammeovirga agarivorans]
MRVQGLKKIVISGNSFLRDFSIGIQLLPIIKKYSENTEIHWIGSEEQSSIVEYIPLIQTFTTFDNVNESTFDETDAVILLSENNDICKMIRDLKIPLRIGGKTSWRYNRRLTDVINTDNVSSLIEAYYLLLFPLGITMDQCFTSKDIIDVPVQTFRGIIKKDLNNLLFYPYRENAHRAWPGIRYFELIDTLPKYEHNYIIGGFEDEGKALKFTSPELFRAPSVKDYTEIEDLEEGLALIGKSNLLITYNTDIAHFAYAMGKDVLVVSSSAETFYLHNDIRKVITPDASCIKCVGDKPCECLKKMGIEEVQEEVNQTFHSN